MVVSAAKTTEKEILLDVDEATKMLRLLQYKDDDPIILCCYGQTNLYHPPRPTNESIFVTTSCTPTNNIREEMNYYIIIVLVRHTISIRV